MTNSYEKEKIGDTRLPYALSSSILARAFKEHELKDIYESYRNARFRSAGRDIGPPTTEQYKLAEQWAAAFKAGITLKDCAAKLKVETSIISSATRRVAVYKYMNG